MNQWWIEILDVLQSDYMLSLVEATVKVVVGLILARVTSRGVPRLFKQLDTNQEILLQRGIYYGILALFIASALQDLGFNLGILLGAAGILTVAIGFASQTSASNVISGLFLLGEKPFKVGDMILIDGTRGEVVSIDLLSVKLRTFDNLFVRIPNETVIKSEVTNIKRYPIRRYDMQVGVAYKEDMNKVRKVLLEVADRNPMCLEEPKPLIMFQGFEDSAQALQFSVWVRTENFLEFRGTIATEVKAAFDEAGIEIPFPHRSLYTGSITDPFPIQLVDADDAADALPDEAEVVDDQPSGAD